MREERHIFVTGLVQGVGFRAAIKRHALRGGIKGFVRNLSDGRVEICVQGSSEQMDAFIKTIREEPGLGRIDHLDVNQRKANQIFDSFQVI